jgi:hypothetical protein
MREYTIDYKYVISVNVVEEDEDKAQELVEATISKKLRDLNDNAEYTGKDRGVWLCDVLERDVVYLQDETSE